jgi:hypothetical protein
VGEGLLGIGPVVSVLRIAAGLEPKLVDEDEDEVGPVHAGGGMKRGKPVWIAAKLLCCGFLDQSAFGLTTGQVFLFLNC